MKLPFHLFAFLLAFAAPCLAQPSADSDLAPEGYPSSTFHREYLEQCMGFPLAHDSRLELYDTIVNWLGTPYRYAGNCEKGIDCSGLVYMLCSRVYGLNPGARTSHGLYDLVEKIDTDQLKEGDLLFFRIYKNRISHVGMYLSQGKFVHASSSRGVIVSDLNEAYYRKHFAGSGRLPSSLSGITDTP